MKLANAARWADRTRLYDAYSGRFVMNAQVSSYIDNQMDGAISKRRVISFAPDNTLPARRAVTYANERWIIGDTLSDMWKGRVIRLSAASKKVTGLYRIMTPGQAALDQTGTEAYGQLVYLKDTVNTIETSAYSPQFEVYFAAGEPSQQGYIVKLPDRYLHVRSVYPILDGFITAVSDDIGPDARVEVTLYERGDFDPITDSYPETESDTFGILVDFYKLYGKDTPLTYNQLPGDMTLLLSNAVNRPKVGIRILARGEHWTVMQVVDTFDAYRLQLRRVA